MLSAREADLDAKVFRLILEDVRSEVSEDDEQDKRIEIGDINTRMKAGSFFPIYDRETDLLATVIEHLDHYSREGEGPEEVTDVWCHFAAMSAPSLTSTTFSSPRM